MRITFGIITGGDQSAFINEIIDSIESEAIPHYEIIIVGACSIQRARTVVYEFPPDKQLPWITKKKNLIAQASAYETIVFLHDYIKLEKGWYSGYLQFVKENPEWDVGMCKLKQSNGQRAIDWMGLPNDPVYGNILLPYDYCNPKGMYVPGNFFIVKRDFLRKHPLDETRIWGQGEDIEWSKRIFGGSDSSEWLRTILRKPVDASLPDPEHPAVYRMNPYSSVIYMKEKAVSPDYFTPYDYHSGDNSRPKGFKEEDYLYMRKRRERKIESIPLWNNVSHYIYLPYGSPSAVQ
jgi:hypothetical protein